MVVRTGTLPFSAQDATLRPDLDGVAYIDLAAGVWGSGSLLAGGQWVLTAAHVAKDFTTSSRVQFLSGGQVYNYTADRVVINPGYSQFDPGDNNDIALIHLTQPVGSNIPTYQIYRGNYELGSQFLVTGFGFGGVGITGQLATTSTKAWGVNTWDVVTSVPTSYAGNPLPGKALVYDFDDGTAAHDALGTYINVPGLGIKDYEASQANGDSGGPELLVTFGRLQIAGVTDEGFATPIGSSYPARSAFGSVQFDARVSVYASWIDSVMGANPFVTGTSGNDAIFATSLSERIDGGPGRDTVFEPGKLADSTGVTHNADASWTFTMPNSGTDTVYNVERLRFYDGVVVFDGGSNGPAAYRLYQAAFARSPDEGGLRVQIGALDAGTSLLQLGAAFIGSAEFQGKYGLAPTDGAFVDLLYQNVLRRLPDAGGRAVQVGALQGGLTREQMLVNFSESAENVAQTAPLTTVGLVMTFYDPAYG